jgi:hypothetical protein
MSPKVKVEEEVKEVAPTPADIGWQDHVFSHLTEEELINGNPTTDGLRGIAPIVLGHKIRGTAKVVQAPTKDNGMVATVEYTVQTVHTPMPYTGGTISWLGGNDYESFTDCADASPSNCNPPFSLHCTAMASTRAEGRALRKLLKLRKVATVEELDVPRDAKDNEGNPTYINFSQISALNNLFKKNDLNGVKYINKYTEKYHSARYPIAQTPYAVAVELIKHVQKWGQGKNPDDLPVPPAEVQGYDDTFMQEWDK